MDLHPNIAAAITGFAFGFLLSIPVGPVNLTIINEGARRGFLWALMIALGAVTMELIYCTIAFTGFASFFEKGVVKAVMELSSFVFMLYLGLKFVRAKTVEASNKIEKRIEGKIHPRTAYGVGFVRVMGNPGVLLLWIVLAANFISREWVEPNGPGKFSCIVGVGCGASLWFLGLSYAVSQRKKKLTERTLLLMERFSGVGLLIYALAHGARIIWQMSHHRI